MDKRRIDEVDSRRDSAIRTSSMALAAPRVLSRDEAIGLVRRYKQVIAPRFDVEPRVMMFGSYSKGYANPDSDIDVAVIVPTYGNRKLEISKLLWHDVDQVSFLIEPVLIAEDRWSPLYDDVMRTGVVV
ncbi:MAG: nucleotidyltransferase domain-containing protein [Prevotella sp.]|nr:nucleotidyltransferase domain-containing protein [Prevotella sp.]